MYGLPGVPLILMKTLTLKFVSLSVLKLTFTALMSSLRVIGIKHLNFFFHISPWMLSQIFRWPACSHWHQVCVSVGVLGLKRLKSKCSINTDQENRPAPGGSVRAPAPASALCVFTAGFFRRLDSRGLVGKEHFIPATKTKGDANTSREGRDFVF